MIRYLFLLLAATTSAQTLPPVESGTITLVTGQRVSFTNLRMQDGEVVFRNSDTQSDFRYLPNAIVRVTDQEGNLMYEDEARAKTMAQASERKETERTDHAFYRAGYPDGVYLTRESFLQRKPDNTEALVAKGVFGFEKPLLDDIADHCYFYYFAKDAKVKRVFAVSYRGCLYFQVSAIFKNRNEKDRAQTSDMPNSFFRVLDGGQRYLYMEVPISNIWADGLAYGGLGGVAGSAVAEQNVRLKGVVWDIARSEFNIFRNCKDYNDFIAPLYPEGVLECPKHHYPIEPVRMAIAKIK